jgi:hypothetical protein
MSLLTLLQSGVATIRQLLRGAKRVTYVGQAAWLPDKRQQVAADERAATLLVLSFIQILEDEWDRSLAA